MYEKYLAAGGKLSREAFEDHLNQVARCISGCHLLAPPWREVKQFAFEHICQGLPK